MPNKSLLCCSFKGETNKFIYKLNDKGDCYAYIVH